MADQQVVYRGPGFLGLLTLLFIGLKLAGVIDWSWWLVLSPLILGWVALVVFILVVAAWLMK